MSEETPKPLENAVAAQAPAILQHWQAARPELAALNTDDVRIELLGKQGLSRATFMVHAGDAQAILSVNTPDPSKRFTRASIPTQRLVQDAWRRADIPVPETIGDVLPLHLDGTDYDCEMTEFCHGFQVNDMRDLSNTSIKSLANIVAKSHVIAKDIHPEDRDAPFTMRAKNLPYGMVHFDLHAPNLIFNSDTEEVAGIIDFERTRYHPFAYDIHDVIKYFVHAEMDPETKQFTLSGAEQIRTFLSTYQEERPLSKRELLAIGAKLTSHIYDTCRAANNDAMLEHHYGEVVKNNLAGKVGLRANIIKEAASFVTSITSEAANHATAHDPKIGAQLG